MSDAHPWNDPAAKIEAVRYCRWAYDWLFPQLAVALNKVHGEARSLRYWRVLVGPWLLRYIEAKYEAYADPGNEFKSFRPIWMEKRERGLMDSIRNAYAAALDLVGRTRPFILCDLHMSHLDMWRICAASGFRAWPMIRRAERPDPGRSDADARVRFRRTGFDFGPDEFCNVLVGPIAEDMPSLYLEDYPEMKRRVRLFLSGCTTVFVSGSGWKSNERLKFIAAAKVEAGAGIVGAQHGGNTGWSVCAAMDDFIAGTAHAFFTWGIADGIESAVPVPDPVLNRLKRKHAGSHDPSGPIFFAGTAFARYASAGIRTQPMSRQMMEYFDWQNRFFRAAGGLRKEFFVRTYPSEYGWQNKIRLLQEFPDLDIDDFSEKAVHHLMRCRLAVIDNPQTMFLEALAMDRPCVLYYDPELWKMKAHAEAQMNELAGAGIVHFDPERAAKFVRKIHSDPMAWWRSPDASSARRSFMNWCLRFDRRWPEIWWRKLMEIPRCLR